MQVPGAGRACGAMASEKALRKEEEKYAVPKKKKKIAAASS